MSNASDVKDAVTARMKVKEKDVCHVIVVKRIGCINQPFVASVFSSRVFDPHLLSGIGS